MFEVGDVVIFKITGAKVMVLWVKKPESMGDSKSPASYTVRLPNYNLATGVQEFELEAIKE